VERQQQVGNMSMATSPLECMLRQQLHAAVVAAPAVTTSIKTYVMLPAQVHRSSLTLLERCLNAVTYATCGSCSTTCPLCYLLWLIVCKGECDRLRVLSCYCCVDCRTCWNSCDTTDWKRSTTRGLGGGGPWLAVITGCLLLELISILQASKL
jgi:hypothetical protein